MGRCRDSSGSKETRNTYFIEYEQIKVNGARGGGLRQRKIGALFLGILGERNWVGGCRRHYSETPGG